MQPLRVGVFRAVLVWKRKLPDECDPTISDHTKQHCRNKRSMITPEAWTPVIINSIVILCIHIENITYC